MKTLILLLSAATLTISIPTFAAPPSDASVEQLLKLTKADKLTDTVFKQMDGMMKAAMRQATKGQPLNAEQQAIVNQQQTDMIAIMKDELSWSKIKGMYVQVYRDTFSQEEINGLITFYKSPTGQAFVDKQPELIKRTMAIMQQRMTPMIERIQKMEKETAAELQKAETKGSSSPAAK